MYYLLQHKVIQEKTLTKYAQLVVGKHGYGESMPQVSRQVQIGPGDSAQKTA